MTKKELIEKLAVFNDDDVIVIQHESGSPKELKYLSSGGLFSGDGTDQPLVILVFESEL